MFEAFRALRASPGDLSKWRTDAIRTRKTPECTKGQQGRIELGKFENKSNRFGKTKKRKEY